jgi:hypothetical protein
MSAVNPQIQANAQQQQQQARQAQPIPAQQPQQQQHPIDLDAKKFADMMEALNLIGVLRENINIIIDNVGKTNSANNYSRILASKTNRSPENQNAAGAGNTQGGSNENEAILVDESGERIYNLDLEQQDFFEKTDNKYLHERVVDINKSIV